MWPRRRLSSPGSPRSIPRRCIWPSSTRASAPPGVRSRSRTARGDFLVGPDNGLLRRCRGRRSEASTGAWALDIGTSPRRGPVCRRRGRPPPSTGATCSLPLRPSWPPEPTRTPSAEPVDPASLVRLAPPFPPSGRTTGVSAPVIEIDRFGNVGLASALRRSPVPGEADAAFLVEVAGEGTARVDRPGGADLRRPVRRANSGSSGLLGTGGARPERSQRGRVPGRQTRRRW